MMTDNFIKMCGKNKNLQKECSFYKGDWFFYDERLEVLDETLDSKYIVNLFKKGKTWLPTQEQLQEILNKITKGDWKLVYVSKDKLYYLSIMINGIEWCYADKDIKIVFLNMIMCEKYKKVWNREKWVKA